MDWLEVQFAARSVEKEYLCVCEGPPLDSGVVELPLFTDRYERGGARTVVCTKRGLPARTDYEVISKVTAERSNESNVSGNEIMLVKVKPLTGRTHQIRVHMASLGRPILGDMTYGQKERSLIPMRRLFLHCKKVVVRDLAGEVFTIEASLPKDLQQILQSISLCFSD